MWQTSSMRGRSSWVFLAAGVLGCGARTIGDRDPGDAAVTPDGEDPCVIPKEKFGSDRAIAIGRCQPSVGRDARVWKIMSGTLAELETDGRSPTWLVWFEPTASGKPITVGMRAGVGSPKLGGFSRDDSCVPSAGDPVSSESITPAAYARLRPLGPGDAIHLNLSFEMNSECVGATSSGVTALWQIPDFSIVRAVAKYSWTGDPGPLCGPCSADDLACPVCTP
jgi:hypothetical protein